MRVHVCIRLNMCVVGRVNGTHVYVYTSAEAAGRVHTYAERGNVRTSPLDFVDGISTRIDYFAINVCRKYGNYACREP